MITIESGQQRDIDINWWILVKSSTVWMEEVSCMESKCQFFSRTKLLLCLSCLNSIWFFAFCPYSYSSFNVTSNIYTLFSTQWESLRIDRQSNSLNPRILSISIFPFEEWPSDKCSHSNLRKWVRAFIL